MQVLKKYRATHFKKEVIPVRFAVIHYTAQSLKNSLEIFCSGRVPVSCHFLIDLEGVIYELVDCYKGECKKAFHAGKTVYQDLEGKTWDKFNDFSLGIELVNFNGNVFKYPLAQYKSLVKLLSHLKTLYPELQNPERIIGHEDIAGFRGKKDPGILFDWETLFRTTYLNQAPSFPQKRESMSFNKASVPKNRLQIICELFNKSYPKHLKEQRSEIFLKKTWKQYQSLTSLRDLKKWDDKKARRISLLMENLFLPFWLKKILYRVILL